MSGGGLELDDGVNTEDRFRPIKEDVDSETGLDDADSSDEVGNEQGISNDYSSCDSSSLTLTKNRSPPELMPWLRHFRSQILAPILRSAKSLPFRKPVDPVALGIFPIYNQIIKKPMDLGTVRQNIDGCAYETKEECISDLMLVWENATTFNAPGHPVHVAAAELRDQCQSRIDRLLKEGLPVPAPKPTPILLPTRESLIRREARKKSFDLPGEVSSPQHLEQKYVGRLSSSLKACDIILRNLLTVKAHKEYVEPFMQVDRKLENELQEPMSLLRIQTKMRNLQYKHPLEFADDVRRIVTETYRHCSPDDPLVSAAGRLQQEFELAFAKINFQENELVPPVLTSNRVPENDGYGLRLLSTQNFMIKIQTDLTELIKDYLRMKKRNKNRVKQEKYLAGIQMTPGVTRTKKTHSTKRMPIQPPAKKPKFETPPPTPTPSPKQFLTLQQANNLKDEISKLDPLDQFRILEILQANGERVVPDANGEVEIEIIKCSEESVKDVRSYLTKLKKQKREANFPKKQKQPQKKQSVKKVSRTSRLSDSSSDSDSSNESSSSDDSSGSSSDTDN